MPPDMSALSEDRWRIRNLGQDDEIVSVNLDYDFDEDFHE